MFVIASQKSTLNFLHRRGVSNHLTFKSQIIITLLIIVPKGSIRRSELDWQLNRKPVMNTHTNSVFITPSIFDHSDPLKDSYKTHEKKQRVETLKDSRKIQGDRKKEF